MTTGTTQHVPGSVRRLACLADVHANYAALDAVLRSEEFASADAVAFLGCITTGPEPIAVLERCAELTIPTYYLAGNGERSVVELADGTVQDEWPTGHEIVRRHGASGLATIRTWPKNLVVDVTGLGSVRLCHGSPRSDIELFTPCTSEERIADAASGIEERVIVHGHTHLQYERVAGKYRVVGAGSVGLPYTDDGFGACWALLGPDVELIRTSYDLATEEQRVAATSYPDERYIQTLREPPSPATVMADAELREFSE